MRVFRASLRFAARLPATIYTIVVASAACGYDYATPPEKASLMVVSCHPDDEGIFFGGAIPYYAAAQKIPMVHISMTSGDAVLAPEVRENELRDADWFYGLRNEPIFPRFKDHGGLTLSQNYDLWLDGVLDNNPSQEAAGRLKTASYVATQIRRYKPDVIITHDFDGETPHTNHIATAWAVADAYSLAADPNVDLDDLPAWQTKKLYIHQSENNCLGTTGVTFQNWLFHDFWEDVSIDSDDDGAPDSTPRQIADLGLEFHVSQGEDRWAASSVYRTDEYYDGHHSEWWGLYASTVGPDTMIDSFTIEGYTYTGWARGDFFEHVSVPEPSVILLLAIAGIVLFIYRSRKPTRKQELSVGNSNRLLKNPMSSIYKVSLILIVLILPSNHLLVATDSTDGKSPKLAVLERTIEPLLKCDRPWEDFMISYFCVMRIGDQWQLWYNAHDHNFKDDNDSYFCYAQSKDGIRWEKPSLGLYSYNGSKDNNIMTNGYNVGSVIFDDKAPPDERFKAVGVHMDRKKANGWWVYGATSPNGTDWQWLDEPLLAKNSDTAVVCIRDDSVYRLFVRMWTGPGTWGGTRMIGCTESPVFGGFPDPEIILKPDENDPTDFHLYNSAVTKLRDDLYIMFPSGFFKSDGSLKIYAAFSRDGKHFTRLGRTPLLDLGKGFDSKGLYVANGAIPGEKPNTYWLYYIGTTVSHDENKPQKVHGERGYGRFLLEVRE